MRKDTARDGRSQGLQRSQGRAQLVTVAVSDGCSLRAGAARGGSSEREGAAKDEALLG